MSSTVKSRPNHYEILGLTPAASSDEIAQAFARELSAIRLSPIGSLASVTVAYETLRDRIKREAYDISLGLKPEPKPSSPPPPLMPQEWTPFAMRASPRPAPGPALAALPRPAPKTDAPPRSKSGDEPKISPFVAAASPSEPSNSDFRQARPRTPTEQSCRAEATAKPRFDLPAGSELHFEEATRFRFDGAGFSEWKIPALAGGALILAVGLGAWTGLEAGNDQEQAATDNPVTLKVPAAKPLPELAGSPLTPPPKVADEEPQRRTRAAARVERSRPPLRIDLPEAGPSESTQLGRIPPAEIDTEQVAAKAPTVEPTAATLPLSDAVIAHTIERIGYPCGEVSGTTAMGAPGVFKVNCRSGHSYRAAPVRGRYRFRQLGSR